MANIFFTFLCFLPFLLVLSQGAGVHVCNPFITISQVQTVNQIHGQNEWKVTVTNQCDCTQLNVQITCAGIDSSTLALDPSLVTQSGNICTLNNGGPIHPHTSFTFQYAWEKIDFQPFDSTEACS
nr:protein TAPETUM DETERMINANT 1-like [Ipomoea batatas]